MSLGLSGMAWAQLKGAARKLQYGNPGFIKHQLKKALLRAVQQLYPIQQGCGIHMHIYTPGDEQYCKWTTRKTRAEADLRVRRSARSRLTTGKRTRHLPSREASAPGSIRRPAHAPASHPASPRAAVLPLIATPRARFLS